MEGSETSGVIDIGYAEMDGDLEDPVDEEEGDRAHILKGDASKSFSRRRSVIGESLPIELRDDHEEGSDHGHGLRAWERSKFNSVESLDYQILDTEIYREHIASRSRTKRNKTVYKWIAQFVIGGLAGTTAFIVSICVEKIEEGKFALAEEFILRRLYLLAFFFYLLICVGLIMFSSALVVYLQPAAAGSGIPEVKAYLNGLRVPKAFNIKTLVLKVLGVICSVSSGLCVGPEGPMIHTGAIIGAGVSQGKSKTLHFNLYRMFQNDRDKRDFISAGAAAGVSAAFNAPIGGILFSLEEISSFWAIDLTWQSFFGSMIAVYSSNLFTAWVRHNSIGAFRSGSYILFEVSEREGYYYPEVFLFIILGAIGGITGALFNHVNRRISLFRRDYLRKKKFLRVAEATLICALTVSIAFWLPLLWPCRDAEERFNEEDREPVRYNCPEGQFNSLATLMFTGQEKAIRHLFSRHTTDEFDYASLVCFWLFYFVFAVVTAGMSISSGLVVPMLIIGGVYGRLLGHAVAHVMPWLEIDAGTYALVGASSFLGGVSRMTVSMSVIMLEITNDIEFLLPIMLVFMVSKWVGDLLSHPLYDMLLEVKCLPCLEWAPPNEFRKHDVSWVMTPDPVCFREVEEVGAVLNVLQRTTHNGFPVIDIGPNGDKKTFLGMVLRRHLLTVLGKKLFQPSNRVISVRSATYRELRSSPRSIGAIVKKISLEEREMFINIAPYVNRTSFTCQLSNNIEVLYVLFRTLGMRHLPVVDVHNEVRGIITRKELYEHMLHDHAHKKPKSFSDGLRIESNHPNEVELVSGRTVHRDGDLLFEENDGDGLYAVGESGSESSDDGNVNAGYQPPVLPPSGETKSDDSEAEIDEQRETHEEPGVDEPSTGVLGLNPENSDEGDLI